MPSSIASTVYARKISSAEKRRALLSERAGERAPMLESAVQGWLRRLSARYRGSPWRLLSLSNGGLYFAPEVSSPVSLHWSGNGFRGDVSADAAGIVATLFALSTMAHADGDEVLDRLYFLLREHAFAHRERKSIIRAVD